MEIKFTNYLYKEERLNFEIPTGTIIGITGKNKEDFAKLIALKLNFKGQVIIDSEKITKEKISTYRKKISYIEKELKTHHTTILNIMIDNIKRQSLSIKNPNKKMLDSLKIVGLEEDFIEKDIRINSSSEKRLLQIAISLLSNPDIIIIEEPFKCLDKQAEKRIIMLLNRLKEQFQKTIIIISDDSNILYKYTTNMIFIKNDKIILDGPTDETYLKVEFLKKNKFEIPDIVEFTHIAKTTKKVKLDYHKDVRDIIKDIYKHI